MSAPGGREVVVVGGGVIGLACAWRAAGGGWSVTVVDPAPGRGASWVAGGMLAPAAEVQPGDEALLALGRRSAERYPAFVAELAGSAGTDPGYTRRGTLIAARDTDDAAQLRVLHDLQHRWGLAAERLTSREARRLEPALGPAVRGGLWLPDDHQIDNRRLVGALIAGCRQRDVAFVDRPATTVATSATGRARVVLDDGRAVEGDEVVVAAGAASGRQPAIDVDGRSTELPVRPVKGQIVRVRATGASVAPTRTVRGLEVYVIPRDHGEIAIGATSEERGFDTRVTAGAVRELLDRAWELLPGLAEAEFVEVVAGLRPGTPDNAPLLGRLGGAGGPIVATGHYRHGVLFAPVTADAVLALLDATATPVDLTAFAPDRFAGGCGLPASGVQRAPTSAEVGVVGA